MKPKVFNRSKVDIESEVGAIKEWLSLNDPICVAFISEGAAEIVASLQNINLITLKGSKCRKTAAVARNLIESSYESVSAPMPKVSFKSFRDIELFLNNGCLSNLRKSRQVEVYLFRQSDKMFADDPDRSLIDFVDCINSAWLQIRPVHGPLPSYSFKFLLSCKEPLF